jgi:hypothetical protein
VNCRDFSQKIAKSRLLSPEKGRKRCEKRRKRCEKKRKMCAGFEPYQGLKRKIGGKYFCRANPPRPPTAARRRAIVAQRSARGAFASPRAIPRAPAVCVAMAKPILEPYQFRKIE